MNGTQALEKMIKVSEGGSKMDIKNAYYSVFLGVASALKMSWFELLESDEFEIVKKACEWLDDYDEVSFKEWDDEMAEDL
jgi:hypothetical protein